MAGDIESVGPGEDRALRRRRRREWRRRTRALVVVAAAMVAAVPLYRRVPAAAVAGRTLRELTLQGGDSPWGEIALRALGATANDSATRDDSASMPGVTPPQATIDDMVWPTPIITRLGEQGRPGEQWRLTEGGCCAQAWWTDDSGAVLFLDRPPGVATSGIYQVALWPPGAPALPADLTLTRGAGAARFTIRSAGDGSVVEDHKTGNEWPVATAGHPALVSSDGRAVVWWEARGDSGHYDAAVRVFAASVRGGQTRELVTLWGARVVGILPEGRRVVVTGRPVRDRPDFVLATIDVESGRLTQIAKGAWLSDAVISPSGEWVAYVVSLDSRNSDANGVWLASTAGAAPQRLPFEGAYRWRDGSRLAFMPLDMAAATDSVWEYDATSGRVERLVGSGEIEVRVANNDWSVAPDGRHLMYRSASDMNLWVIRLP
ncbi:MAG: hypothetical protein ACE5EL_07365 [Anaerolineae bacterium]